MSQSSDFETLNFVAASLFTPGPLTPAPSTPEPSTPAEARATRRDEDRLFRHFRGYTWSQRSRNIKSWVWEYGFDIEKDSERRWVCRLCIERNRPKRGNVVAIGTQNAERHLWDHHKIQDPSGKRSAPASRKKPSTGYQTITKAFIACFFRNEDGKAGKLILGVPELTVRHFGANIGHEIIEILESYEISEEKIGYFTLDNAQNNDTAMDTIRERFKFHGKERLSMSFGEREVRSASSIILWLRSTDLIYSPHFSEVSNGWSSMHPRILG
ncbi:transposase [Fusarium langsethiae]|uniref:Transposase n=1 Tax=Fusarium langsethiae TaxID=179993 RepID=A0A0M9ELG2_FUSLA|nr:transposase [Fusarium langsethiae]GKU09264.1 unnamed protein product [Fusarium langsethiae]